MDTEGRKKRKLGNVESKSLSISPFSLHFLILSPFPLHFLVLSPFSHSQAGRLAQLVQPCCDVKNLGLKIQCNIYFYPLKWFYTFYTLYQRTELQVRQFY